ncbi:MAG TPA: DUF3501 family protein [Aliidongia sp.]|nr:DUF3501 family protein [Aliidongia sp.]
MPKRTVEAADLLALPDYLPRRAQERTRIAEIKKRRRLEVGPFATFYFESWDTIRHQIQEMLYIEKGGDEQLADELEAYGPLVPRGGELIATVMFEIDDPVRRLAALNRIGGIESHMFLQVGGRQIRGVPDAERENTSPEGKASSVQFCHFPFDTETVAAFRAEGTQILVGFDHPNYGHIAVMPQPVRAALAEDL